MSSEGAGAVSRETFRWKWADLIADVTHGEYAPISPLTQQILDVVMADVDELLAARERELRQAIETLDTVEVEGVELRDVLVYREDVFLALLDSDCQDEQR